MSKRTLSRRGSRGGGRGGRGEETHRSRGRGPRRAIYRHLRPDKATGFVTPRNFIPAGINFDLSSGRTILSGRCRPIGVPLNYEPPDRESWRIRSHRYPAAAVADARPRQQRRQIEGGRRGKKRKKKKGGKKNKKKPVKDSPYCPT